MNITAERKHLVIITGSFPFLKKETFLETEIVFLAKAFNKITVVPTKVEGEPRAVPGNVFIDTSFSKKFKKGSRKLKSAASILFLKGLVIHKKYLLNISAVRRINSFVSDALLTSEWLNESISSISGYAIIYTYWLNGKTYGAELFAKNHAGIKIASRAHRYDLYDYWFKPAFWPFRQQSLDRIDFLYLISTDGDKYLQSNYKIGAGKQGVFRLGVNDNNILTARSTDGVIRIVSVAGLLPVKRIELLAAYLIEYCRRHPADKIHWTHIGDGVCKPLILERLQKNSLQNLSYNFPGQQNNKEVFEYYRGNPVDLFVNISESEGIPVSIMEAQACGILVAATDVGGSSEIVNKQSGILLPANPSYEVFEEILNNINEYLKRFTPGLIKDFWYRHYNAQENYQKFAKHLAQL